jgi:AraC-like DNA-binding protein
MDPAQNRLCTFRNESYRNAVMDRGEDHRVVFAFEVSTSAGHVGYAPPGVHVAMVHTGQSSGRLEYADGRGEAFGPDCIFVYDSQEKFAVHTAQDGLHTCLGLAGRYARQLPRGVFQASPAMVDRVEEIRGAMRKPASQLRAQRMDLLVGLLAVELLEAHQGREQEASARDDLAGVAREIMDHQFAQLSGPGELAQSLYISREYLRQLFRKRFGVSPLEYLIRRRIDAACQMLRFSDLLVGTVALRCGFESPYYFSRMFKKLTGQPPSLWRKACRADDLPDSQNPSRA